jgi:hypothetical protein
MTGNMEVGGDIDIDKAMVGLKEIMGGGLWEFYR